MCSKHCVALTLSIVCCGWMLGVFFGLNYPEIRRNTVYFPTNCTVISTSVVPYRYCSKSCTYCSSYYGTRTCVAISDLNQQLDKYDLSYATEQRIEGSCDNGYICCHEHCDTCRSCTSSCRRLSTQKNQIEVEVEVVNEKAKVVSTTVRALLSRRITHKEVRRRRLQKKSCHTTCHTYDCHCYCQTSTNHQECSYTCVPHYESHVAVSFPWRADGTPPTSSDSHVQTTVVLDYGVDSSKATLYLDEHFHDVGNVEKNITMLPCYYDPDWNPSDVSNRYNQITGQQLAFEWELGYEAWKWVLFGVPAFSVLLLLVAVSHFLLNVMCPFGVAGIASHYKLLLSLWCGFLFPLGLFLPLQAGKVNDQGKEILHVLMFVFVGLFNVPSLYDLTKRRILGVVGEEDGRRSAPLVRMQGRRSSSHYSLHALISVSMGWLLPLGIVCPYSLSYWWLPSARPPVVLSLTCFFIPFLFFLILYPWMVRKWRLHVVVSERSDANGGSWEDGGSGAMQTGLLHSAGGTQYDSVVDQNMQDWAAAINSHVVPTPFGKEEGDGSVPLAPTPSAPPDLGLMEVEHTISKIATVNTTKELLYLLERLRHCNTCGQISKKQRGLLIVKAKHRRDLDSVFRDQIWTNEVSEAYGHLLRS